MKIARFIPFVPVFAWGCTVPVEIGHPKLSQNTTSVASEETSENLSDESLAPLPVGNETATATSNLEIPPSITDDTTLTGLGVARLQIDWSPDGIYTLTQKQREDSGTTAFLKRASTIPTLGSFRGFVSKDTGSAPVYYDSIGTGRVYEQLTRGLSFRFPLQDLGDSFHFRVEAQINLTNDFETIFETTIDVADLAESPQLDVSVTEMQDASEEPSLRMVFYAEGYAKEQEAQFLEDTQVVIDQLEADSFPMFNRLAFAAVFSPSNATLNTPEHLGEPVPVQDSFLGLYYPYWTDSWWPRWNKVVYPTDENKLRTAFAQTTYDYPFALSNDSGYWGVGNYNMFTAVPAGGDIGYLVLHEAGHYFGLNEEYPANLTELTFGEGSEEPWSQNVTFQTERDAIKWRDYISEDTSIPTSYDDWPEAGVGAYPGGYAGVDARAMIPVATGGCIMSWGSHYCPVCAGAIEDKMHIDLGEAAPLD